MEYEAGYRDANRLLSVVRSTPQAVGTTYADGFMRALSEQVAFRPLNEV